MHELAVAQAIVAAAERHAEDRPISVVRVRVGRPRQVVPEYLGFYFDVASKETLCEGLRSSGSAVDSRLRCPACGGEWDPAPPPARERRRADRPLPLPGVRVGRPPRCQRRRAGRRVDRRQRTYFHVAGQGRRGGALFTLTRKSTATAPSGVATMGFRSSSAIS